MAAHRRTLPAALVALAALAGPAAAQGVSCGGVGDGAPWLGGAREGSDLATVAAPLGLSNLAVAPGTRAAAVFTLGRPMAVRLEAAPVDAFGDTIVELFDGNGRLVVLDDDSGGGLASRAEVELPAGDYCVAVTGYAGLGVTANLQVSRLEMAALTPGLAGGFSGTEGMPLFVGVQPCLPGTPATPLGQGPVDAQLMQGLRATNTILGAPYYRFTLASPQALTIRADNPAADPYIYLFDGQGVLLAENDDYESLNSRIDMTRPLPAGDYCIAMRSLSDPNLPVTVTVTGFDARAAAAEQYASGEAAPPLDGSWPVTDLGRLPPMLSRDWRVPGGQAQWFVMEVPTPGLLLVTADEINDSDPVVTFFDAAGRMLGMNDDSNGTLNSQLAVPVRPGRYLLAVRQYAPSYQGMIRIGVTRYVPATQ
ncbi:DVUA0089 family protein [Roseicyclus persicicus]|uniref:ABC transporter substrate-binding protein n=1 Tax=Roseicyclus persicicus TaxID=2650661 RepID=A0A7X6H430_9RHOB|nr:DVUA0089 family protein [Roseibacterium persicicum]NKX46447.1 ABC transporter substrate-binding protein [Roseibacterium persicicum]